MEILCHSKRRLSWHREQEIIFPLWRKRRKRSFHPFPKGELVDYQGEESTVEIESWPMQSLPGWDYYLSVNRLPIHCSANLQQIRGARIFLFCMCRFYVALQSWTPGVKNSWCSTIQAGLTTKLTQYSMLPFCNDFFKLHLETFRHHFLNILKHENFEPPSPPCRRISWLNHLQ